MNDQVDKINQNQSNNDLVKLSKDIKTDLDVSGLTDSLIIDKIKELISSQPKRIFASDIIRLIELYAKIKGWVKDDNTKDTVINNYVNMPIEEIKLQINNVFKQLEDINNDK